MICAELVQLLEVAEESTNAAALAFLERANANAEPVDHHCYMCLKNAGRWIAAAMVTAGMVETAPAMTMADGMSAHELGADDSWAAGAV